MLSGFWKIWNAKWLQLCNNVGMSGLIVTIDEWEICSVFDAPRYPTASASIIYPPLDPEQIDRSTLASLVHGQYLPPQMVTGSDGSNALVFQSEHGHSKIYLMPDSGTFVVNFSEDWQSEPAQGLDYVQERVSLMFAIMEEAFAAPRYLYASASVAVKLRSYADEHDLLKHLGLILGSNPDKVSHDLTLKSTQTVDELYYLNATIQNYRLWGDGVVVAPQIRLPNQASSERGIGISVDFNSRLAYNMDQDIEVTATSAAEVEKKAMSHAEEIVDAVERGKAWP